MIINLNTHDFDRQNAYTFALLSTLAYPPRNDDTEEGYRKALNDLIQASHFSQIVFFDVNATQSYMLVSDTAIIVAFRGTQSDKREDWLTDVHMGLVPVRTGKIHAGVKQSIDDVYLDIESYLKKYRDKAQKLYVIGHSLGGGLATEAARRLHYYGHSVSNVYLYGPMNVGDQEYKDRYNDMLGPFTFRLIDHIDIADQLPPSKRYRRVGKMIYLDRKGRVITDTKKLKWYITLDRITGLFRREKNPAYYHRPESYIAALRLR